VKQILAGLLLGGYLVAGLFFLKFWARSHDRLFAMFAAAFGMLAVQRLVLAVTNDYAEDRPDIYLIRLVAFVLIIVAIVDKNRR
jgi:hypothetical protein